MHNEMADKIDVLMSVMQEFILFVCFHDGQYTQLLQHYRTCAKWLCREEVWCEVC